MHAGAIMSEHTPAGRLGAVIGWVGFGLISVIFAALSITALGVHFGGWVFWLAAVALILGLAAAAVLRRRRSRPAGWAMLSACIAAVGLWYGSLTPRQDRDWAPEVANSVSGTVKGDIVTLRNVRAFDWTSDSRAAERWDTRQVDLSQLQTVDMFTSVWDSPEIAHLIVSFGFSDGQHVAFSVEIRKERGEAFSSIGGFFRQFEIALIAADESDVVKLRSNYRKETVSLFPIRLDAGQRRALFLSYLALGNRLNAAPEFYNTVTANCSSTVWRLAKVIKDDVPFDYRLLLSGRLPELLEGLGALPGDIPMAARRQAALISARAQAVPAGADFSDWIRAR